MEIHFAYRVEGLADDELGRLSEGLGRLALAKVLVLHGDGAVVEGDNVLDSVISEYSGQIGL